MKQCPRCLRTELDAPEGFYRHRRVCKQCHSDHVAWAAREQRKRARPPGARPRPRDPALNAIAWQLARELGAYDLTVLEFLHGASPANSRLQRAVVALARIKLQ